MDNFYFIVLIALATGRRLAKCSHIRFTTQSAQLFALVIFYVWSELFFVVVISVLMNDSRTQADNRKEMALELSGRFRHIPQECK